MLLMPAMRAYVIYPCCAATPEKEPQGKPKGWHLATISQGDGQTRHRSPYNWCNQLLNVRRAPHTMLCHGSTQTTLNWSQSRLREAGRRYHASSFSQRWADSSWKRVDAATRLSRLGNNSCGSAPLFNLQISRKWALASLSRRYVQRIALPQRFQCVLNQKPPSSLRSLMDPKAALVGKGYFETCWWQRAIPSHFFKILTLHSDHNCL